MGLLTDIYNTVAKFFRAQETQGEDASKSVAQNRLKLVLMQDRTNLTPKVLEQMRGEMIDLLSKYLEMDKDLLELANEEAINAISSNKLFNDENYSKILEVVKKNYQDNKEMLE